MDVQILPVTTEDVETLLAMAKAFHAEDGHPLSPAGEAALSQLAFGDPFGRAWIARTGGRAAGYVVITMGFSIEYGGRDGFVDDLYVMPEMRKQGLGRKCLDFAISQAAGLGIRTLHLEVEKANTQASEFYRSAGFEETGRKLMRRAI
jgi:ribosomal protein S18 acetylase RimI-like enzyme